MTSVKMVNRVSRRSRKLTVFDFCSFMSTCLVAGIIRVTFFAGCLQWAEFGGKGHSSFHTCFEMFCQSVFFNLRFGHWEAILCHGLGLFRRKDFLYAVSASSLDLLTVGGRSHSNSQTSFGVVFRRSQILLPACLCADFSFSKLLLDIHGCQAENAYSGIALPVAT